MALSPDQIEVLLDNQFIHEPFNRARHLPCGRPFNLSEHANLSFVAKHVEHGCPARVGTR